MARRRKYQRGGDGGTRNDSDGTHTFSGGESHNSGNSSAANTATQSTVETSSESSNKAGGDSNKTTVKRKKTCKSLTGIARVKCVLSKYKGQSGPVGPNIL
jgi:hypothetical protein